MADFEPEIKTIREGLRLTQEEMAEALGVPHSRYKNWEYSTKTPERIMEKAKALVAAENRSPYGSGVREVGGTPMVKVTPVGHASAGEGADDHPDEEPIYVPASMVSGGDCAAWVAEGDSMMPWIKDGDTVIAKLHRRPRPNMAFMVRRESGAVSVKMVKYIDGRWVLRSLNPNYPDEEATVEFLGFITGIYRAKGTKERIDNDPHGLLPDDIF